MIELAAFILGLLAGLLLPEAILIVIGAFAIAALIIHAVEKGWLP